MAHASRIDNCALQLKKARIAKYKKRDEWRLMDEEKKQEIIDARNVPTPLKKQLQTLIWDYEHRQLPEGKYNFLLTKIKERLLELNNDKELFIGEKEKIKKIKGEIENV